MARTFAMVWAVMLFLGAMYIATSSCLIAFNKYLMHEDRFPYAVTLVMLHMMFAATMSWTLYFARPSMFPSMTDPDRKVTIDANLMFSRLLPIAVLFTGQLCLSNHAYLHSSVAFLQMMKEANLVLVYVLSLFVMLESFKWRSVAILCFIIGATSMTIVGEVNFSWTGFFVQGSSQLFETAKIVLQALVLSEAGRKLDAMSYVLLVTPLCACVLLCVQVVLYFTFPHLSFAGAWPHFEAWWMYLIPNALLAFSVNVVIAFFIKNSSAVAFILAGIVKDVMIVSVGTVVFHEHVAMIQVIGFGLQLIGILVWSLTKTFPDNFEEGFFRGMGMTLFNYPPKVKKLKGDYGASNA